MSPEIVSQQATRQANTLQELSLTDSNTKMENGLYSPGLKLRIGNFDTFPFSWVLDLHLGRNISVPLTLKPLVENGRWAVVGNTKDQ